MEYICEMYSPQAVQLVAAEAGGQRRGEGVQVLAESEDTMGWRESVICHVFLSCDNNMFHTKLSSDSNIIIIMAKKSFSP